MTRTAVHFLDNVIDMNRYPLPEIGEMTRSNRKIGLGVMGWADMLVKMGIGYDSDEAIRLAHEVMGFVHEESIKASEELATDRGVFPNWELSTWAAKGKRVRNATLTTIAPTGTISIIANCSSGVEPIFALAFIRNVMDNTELPEAHPAFEQVVKDRGLYSEDLMKSVAAHGGIAELDVPEDLKKVFVTAHDVTPEWHIRMQAAFQDHVDNAVSKTVNFSNQARPEDVERVYLLAYELGVKGVTIYRDGSRQEQVLNIGEVKRKGREAGQALQMELGPHGTSIMPVRPTRSPVLRGETREKVTGCGSRYVTVNEDDLRTERGLRQHGQKLVVAHPHPRAIGRLISLAFAMGSHRTRSSSNCVASAATSPWGSDPTRSCPVPMPSARLWPTSTIWRTGTVPRWWANWRCPSPSLRGPARSVVEPSSTRVGAWSAAPVATPSARSGVCDETRGTSFLLGPCRREGGVSDGNLHGYRVGRLQ